MFSKYALKAAAAFNPDAAKLNLLKRVRELFKKIKEINDQNIDVNEKDGQISELLDATEQGETKPNIELFGPKTYLVKKEIDEPEKAVSILNYLPQFKTTCLETIGNQFQTFPNFSNCFTPYLMFSMFLKHFATCVYLLRICSYVSRFLARVETSGVRRKVREVERMDAVLVAAKTDHRGCRNTEHVQKVQNNISSDASTR